MAMIVFASKDKFNSCFLPAWRMLGVGSNMPNRGQHGSWEEIVYSHLPSAELGHLRILGFEASFDAVRQSVANGEKVLVFRSAQ